MKPDYGNWVPKRLLYGLLIAVLITTALLIGARATKVINAVLAVLIALFNIAHACMELPSDNAGQYIILPMMIVIGIILAWNSIKYVKED